MNSGRTETGRSHDAGRAGVPRGVGADPGDADPGVRGDFDLAEEAMQEAFAVALERWPRDGVPANPGAWITTAARRKAIDRLRRQRTLAEKRRLLEADAALNALAGG